jgi:hypothetical protein
MAPRRAEPDAEARRLAEAASGERDWRRLGPYLSERQWATVREDYSPFGTCWEYLPHDHARSRAYRWGEDGLLGICDREARLCFALALWNERDPILKERLFGLTGPEGNHGEDVKECYFYLDSTPTHSYLKALYKYPHAAFPYDRLVEEGRARGPHDPEFELADAGVFEDGRYFDVQVEYAKADADDVLVRVLCANRGPEAALLHVLPTLWLRNTWAWGRSGADHPPRGCLARSGPGRLTLEQEELGRFRLDAEGEPELLFTENETNYERLYGVPNASPYVKDGFHERVIRGRESAVNPEGRGTKAAAWYRLPLGPGEERVLRLRLANADHAHARPFGAAFEKTFDARRREADAFFEARLPAPLDPEERRVARQAYAGLLWSKQYYGYDVARWLEGDPGMPSPPPERRHGRNADWEHLNNSDVLSMPDKWEYPWYAAWDLAFHMLPFARIDADFAKDQLVLMLREWYMHPNGQIPAYEFAFGDVNPPVHAWACWRVYKIAADRGRRDPEFLARSFQKLVLNFTWWVNRKDVHGHNLFSGGFLGLDNIGVFDRSRPLPTGGHLEQADGTAWMAFYCLTMLAIALELARESAAYEDMATKFFEHFAAIAHAINTLGGTGLWDERDGFYYDQLHADRENHPLRIRSLVGLVPLLAVETIEAETLEALPDFRTRFQWFLDNRPELARHVTPHPERTGAHLLAIPSRDRLERVLRYVLDEDEFLSPHGIRSLSRHHASEPFELSVQGETFRVSYEPGESSSRLFGGNSNWRGPVWFPLNYLLVEALERYHHFFGDALRVECPTGSGQEQDLGQVAAELCRRLASLFLPGASGRRPCHGSERRFAEDPHWKDLLLFHEYFHGESGLGLGASHQTGWTALVTRCLETVAAARRRE